MKRSDAGQATVELALALPVVLVALLLVVQAALVVRAQVLAVHAARATARAAARAPVPDPSSVAARAAPGLPPARLRVVLTHPRGDPPLVRVEVHATVPAVVPLVGPLVGEVTVVGVAAMPREEPSP